MTIFVHRLANELVRRGHSVTFASLDPRPPDAQYEHVLLSRSTWLSSQLGRVLLLPFLLHALERGHPDVVHAHGDDHFYWPRRVATVRTFYGSAAAEAQSATSMRRRVFQTLMARCERLAARLPRAVVSISADTARRLPRNDRIIPCAADFTLFHWAQPHERSVNPSILFVGTVGGRKRGKWLVDVFRSTVRPCIPTAELWMVSDPPPNELIHEPGVRWYGKVSDSQLAALYRCAWTFCLPSTYEGFGIPYVEALASGTPVVATHNPGAREVLEEGKWGRLVEDSDLGAALVEVLNTPEMRRHLAEAGQVRATDFSLSRVAAQYEEVYELAAGQRKCVT